MTKANVYGSDGAVVGEIELNPKFFEVRVSPGLVHQVAVAQQANARVALAHTKTRGEVRGGGKKPWRQKGTGRARHGSIRSPIWKGGGITFGPRSNRNYALKINAKAKQRALFMALSDKAANKKIFILESLALAKIQTKALAAILKNLKLSKSVLIALPKQDQIIWKSARNIPKIETSPVESLNVVDVLKNNNLLLPKSALEKMDKVYHA